MKTLRSLLKLPLEASIDLWAMSVRFSFPKKYTWRWKMNMLTEAYEKDTTDLFKTIVLPGMTIFDVGAHIGYFTRLFSRLVGEKGKVFAFEPDPDNFALLQKNTAHLKNVTPIQAAVSDKSGTINFFEIEDSTGCHTTVPTNAPSKTLRVTAVTIDEFAAEASPRLLKIDIEGGEPAALRGAEKLLTRQDSKIVLELNPEALGRGGTTPKELIAFMRIKGYRAYGILPGGRKSSPIDDIEGLRLYEEKSDFANVLFEK